MFNIKIGDISNKCSEETNKMQQMHKIRWQVVKMAHKYINKSKFKTLRLIYY